MRNTRYIAAVIVLLASAGFGTAQSNEVLDVVLEQEELRVGEAVYLVRVASGETTEDASVETAYTEANWAEWDIDKQPAEAAITLGEFSYLIMEELDISGGVMYRLIPGSRYAARELAYLGYIDGDRSPYRRLSGNEGLAILGAAVRRD